MSSQPLDSGDTATVDPSAPFGLGADPNPSRANLVDPSVVASEHPTQAPKDAAPAAPAEMHPIKELFWLLLSRANVTTAMKQRAHDLIVKHYGEHPNDPMRQPDDPKWD